MKPKSKTSETMEFMAFRFEKRGYGSELGYMVNAIDTTELDEFYAELIERDGRVVRKNVVWSRSGALCVGIDYALPVGGSDE